MIKEGMLHNDLLWFEVCPYSLYKKIKEGQGMLFTDIYISDRISLVLKLKHQYFFRR